MTRLREGGFADPVVRLRPLGIFGFIIMMVLFLVPFAVGEWLLNMIGELFERRANRTIGEDPPPLTPDEETLAGHPPGPWPGADGFEEHLLRRAGSVPRPPLAAATVQPSLIRQIA